MAPLTTSPPNRPAERTDDRAGAGPAPAAYADAAPPFSQPAKAVLEALSVVPADGLATAEAVRRRARYGPNLLRRTRRRSMVGILVDQFRGIIVWLLAGAALLSFLFGETKETLAIIAVIAINAAIGFGTELKALRSMEALSRMARVAAKVRRGGHVIEIPAQDLVPGDIVLLDGGDVVTADLRIIDSAKLQADESILTGESVPVSKSDSPSSQSAPLAERRSMLFKGTAITRGTGEAVVVATGMATELGRISSLVEEAEAETSPLEKRLDRLSGQLAWATILIAAAITVAGILAGRDLVLMIEMGVALAVAAVPEGLPIVATMALARGMWRMAKRNVLIERLSAVETLGSTTLIVTDKTGTLTENRMTVTALLLPTGRIEVGRQKGEFLLDGETVDPEGLAALRQALQVLVLCNNASLAPESDGRETAGAVGDPMEVALLAAAAKAGMHRTDFFADQPELREDAFESELKLMATWHPAADGSEDYVVAVKGAPEAVLAHAGRIAGGKSDEPLDDATRQSWLEKNDALADDGLRVLGIAIKRSDRLEGPSYEDLTFLGLVALIDPPRADVADAMADCREAGIRVVMATGDQIRTARTIARAVGWGRKATALESSQLKPPLRLAPTERAHLLRTDIFARVNPEQKLDLISLHQQNGAVVAMTGDGVNDAPALKKADIGIAMGTRGSQVAREAADMVLRDDAFASIVAAVEQGRIIFSNIRRMVLYLLSCNLSEIFVVCLAAAGGLPLPLMPLQILYLNLVTDIYPAFALGAGEGEAGAMRQPPRDPREAVLTRRHWLSIIGYGTLIAAATLAAFGLGLAWLEVGEAEAVTMSFLTLALAQLWHVFNMRDPGTSPLRNVVTRNPYVWAALALCIVLIALAYALPPLAEVLRLVPLDGTAWTIVVAMSTVPWILGQALKFRSTGA